MTTNATPRKRTSISIDAELADRLRVEAERRVVGPGKLAEVLLTQGLDRLAPWPPVTDEPEPGRVTDSPQA